MSDPISGIKIIHPTYPVKPTQPANKDRESGRQEKDRPKSDGESDQDDEDKPVIDEYV